MKWTGFTKDIPDTNTSFRSSKREELGGLSTVKMTDRIGNDEIIIKTFAERYQKVIYNKTSKEEGGGNLVCVFVGDNRTPFSEYDSGDLIEKTIHYWGVEPETDLSKLFEKKLLVLPCPARILTASETATIKKFLAGERRLVLFSGTDTTISGAILRQLGSKLDILPDRYAHAGYHNAAAFITPKELVWYPAELAGFVTVHKDYWDTAIIKDWKGYGLLYSDVVSCQIYAGTMWSDETVSAEFVAFHGNYKFSQKLIDEMTHYLDTYNPADHIFDHCWWPHTGSSPDAEWTYHFESLNDTLLPTGYITYSYTYADLAISGLRDWMSANQMPLYYICAHDADIMAKTSFAAGQYCNYSNYIYRYGVGSYLAYVPGERIIVSGFKPSWLSMNYDPKDIDSWFATRKLANWFLTATMEYVDLFGDGGFQAPPPVYMHHDIVGSGGGGGFGSGTVIQGP
jgi:hypothetical protein